jgi:hypothetical protein
MSTAELGEKLPEGVFHLLTTDDDVASAYGSSTAAGGPDPSAQAAQDDDSEPSGYFISECGHRVPGGPAWYVGSCKNCDADATYPPMRIPARGGDPRPAAGLSCPASRLPAPAPPR